MAEQTADPGQAEALVGPILGYVAIFLIMVRFDKQRVVALMRAQNEAERRYAAALVDCLGTARTLLTLQPEQPSQRAVASRLEAVFGPHVTLGIEWAPAAVERACSTGSTRSSFVGGTPGASARLPHPLCRGGRS